MNDAFEQAAFAAQAEKQRKRLSGLRTGFGIHAAVFVVIQVLLFTIWAATGAGLPWPVFVLLGWGAGLAAHGMALRAAGRPAA